jgi:hypothetical protein
MRHETASAAVYTVGRETKKKVIGIGISRSAIIYIYICHEILVVVVVKNTHCSEQTHSSMEIRKKGEKEKKWEKKPA